MNDNVTLNWVGKKRTHRTLDTAGDVTLAISQDNTKNKRTSVIAFKHRSYSKITSTGYMVFAVVGTRLYFKSDTSSVGYKLSTFNKDKSSCHVKVDYASLPLDVKLEVGNYNLEWDRNLGLYYIDVLKKLEI